MSCRIFILSKVCDRWNFIFSLIGGTSCFWITDMFQGILQGCTPVSEEIYPPIVILIVVAGDELILLIHMAEFSETKIYFDFKKSPKNLDFLSNFEGVQIVFSVIYLLSYTIFITLKCPSG